MSEADLIEKLALRIFASQQLLKVLRAEINSLKRDKRKRCLRRS